MKNHRLRSRYPFERYTRYPFERYRWYPFDRYNRYLFERYERYPFSDIFSVAIYNVSSTNYEIEDAGKFEQINQTSEPFLLWITGEAYSVKYRRKFAVR